MKSFFGARRTRHTAVVVLLVWLMSLGLGIANACLVQPHHGQHETVSGSHSSVMPASAMERATSGKLDTTDSHVDENDPSPDKLACSNFCGAAQSTLLKGPMDGYAVQDIAPAPTPTWLLVPAVDQATPLATWERPSWSEPPVSIRYVRLTI